MRGHRPARSPDPACPTRAFRAGMKRAHRWPGRHTSLCVTNQIESNSPHPPPPPRHCVGPGGGPRAGATLIWMEGGMGGRGGSACRTTALPRPTGDPTPTPRAAASGNGHAQAAPLPTPIPSSPGPHPPGPLTLPDPTPTPRAAASGNGYDFFVGRDATRAFVTGAQVVGWLGGWGRWLGGWLGRGREGLQVEVSDKVWACGRGCGCTCRGHGHMASKRARSWLVREPGPGKGRGGPAWGRDGPAVGVLGVGPPGGLAHMLLKPACVEL